jgi:Uma2 family endonuclease
MLATKVRYTFADLLAQPPDDEHIYDILGGELVVWSSPNPKHGRTVVALVKLFGAAEDAGFGTVLTAPCAVAFDFGERGVQAQDVTHPDVLFVRPGRPEAFGEWCLVAAPDLVVEVLSPSTRADDLPGGRKYAIYERYGVPIYWLVDPEVRTIAQHTLQDERYGAPVILREGDTLTCPLFPGITYPVAQIFGAMR